MQNINSEVIYPRLSADQTNFNFWPYKETDYKNDLPRLSPNEVHDIFMQREDSLKDFYAQENVNENISRHLDDPNYLMTSGFAEMHEVYFGQPNKRLSCDQPRLEMSEWGKINFMKKENLQKEVFGTDTSEVVDAEDNEKQFNAVRPTSITPIEIYKNLLQAARPFR